MKKRQAVTTFFPGDEKMVSLFEVMVVMREFIFMMIQCNPELKKHVGFYLLEGHTPEEIYQYMTRVALYVVAGNCTRQDIRKQSEGDEDKIAAVIAGQRIVEYFHVQDWYWPDIISGRCYIDEEGQVWDSEDHKENDND